MLSPVEGTVSKHPALKLAKYSQHSADQLPYDKSPVEHLESTYKAKYPEKDIQYWRQQVGRFGVTGAHQTNPISQLSDGLRNVSVLAGCCSTMRTVWLTLMHVILHSESFSRCWLW
jgi:ATP-binding cassette subfamily F protein 2